METVRPSAYLRYSFISFLILLIVLWGFHRTYTVFFPSFEGFVFAHHFHGVVMLLWMLALIVQPMLIARRNYRLHRLVGNFSYALAALVILSMFLMGRTTYFRNLGARTENDAFAEIALSIPALMIFGILYSLAIINRKNTYDHMRYMIGTALLMIGPGLGRLLVTWFGVPGSVVVRSTLIAVAVIGMMFLVADVARKGRLKPFGLVALLLIIQVVLWEVRYSAAWQESGKIFAKVLF